MHYYTRLVYTTRIYVQFFLILIIIYFKKYYTIYAMCLKNIKICWRKRFLEAHKVDHKMLLA